MCTFTMYFGSTPARRCAGRKGAALQTSRGRGLERAPAIKRSNSRSVRPRRHGSAELHLGASSYIGNLDPQPLPRPAPSWRDRLGRACCPQDQQPTRGGTGAAMALRSRCIGPGPPSREHVAWEVVSIRISTFHLNSLRLRERQN
jgi:hypothetical protein